jgi:uncharacterized protein YcbK (DUF882 family)
MIYFTRGSSRDLSPHFRAKEFACKCGICLRQKINEKLIEKLEQVRELYGKPINVTSGFRCERHQQNLRGSGLPTSVGPSQHEYGQAADITGSDLPALLKAVDAVFTSYGIANTFIHVDIRPPRSDGTKRVWNY